MSDAHDPCEHPASVVACPGNCGIPGFHLHWHCGSGCAERVETRADGGGPRQMPLSGQAAQQLLPLPVPSGSAIAARPTPLALLSPPCGSSPAHAFCEADFCHVEYQAHPLLSRCA